MNEKGFTMLRTYCSAWHFAVVAGITAVQLANFQPALRLKQPRKMLSQHLAPHARQSNAWEDGDANGQGDPWGIRFANSTADTYAFLRNLQGRYGKRNCISSVAACIQHAHGKTTPM